MRLALVLGTRPEAIKMAPLLLAARAAGPPIEPLLLSTGQHRDMIAPVLAAFGLSPDRDLGLMTAGQGLSDLAARALTALDAAYAEWQPHAVVVQGDTTTAMAAALAAFHRRIPVVHLEAGLRTDNLDAPFPEEANRRLIGQLARLHLAPTPAAAAALARDGVAATGARVVVTGNTVIDALLHVRARLAAEPPHSPALDVARGWIAGAPGRRVVLVTGHRRENFGEPFREFCLGLRDIADAHPDVLLVYPVHLNPNVRGPVNELLGDHPRVSLQPPAGYAEFIALMDLATLVITDSGGVQEEAPALGRPVLVTRTVTERPEAVEAGGVLLVGPSRHRLGAAAHRLLTDPAAHAAMAVPRFPYGDGTAAARCLAAIRDFFAA